MSLSEKAVEAVFEPPRIMVASEGDGQDFVSLVDLTKRNNAGLKSTIDALDTVFQIDQVQVVLDTPIVPPLSVVVLEHVGVSCVSSIFTIERYSRSEMWRAVMDKAPAGLRRSLSR